MSEGLKGDRQRRRRVLKVLAAGVAMMTLRPAAATPENLAAALRETFGDRPLRPGKVKLELPRLAENGSVVPATVRVDSPMSEADHVAVIHLFAEKNPLPRMLEVRLGPHNGLAVVSCRVRLATTQVVTAVAEMNDGSLWSAVYEVEVTSTGCGL
ncbi:MAG: thiosulfate oxidation carrier protein SoxY [Burkholderiales bacterium]